jgi:DNA-binding IclR family transcriptional regulator
MGNGQLARATGLAPSTVSRLTDSLVQLGYVRMDPASGAYYLTPKNLRLGYPVLANLSIVGRAQRVLDELSLETGVTSALAVRDELHVAFVATARGRDVHAVNVAVGGRLPVALSAAGISLAASIEEPYKSRLLRAIRADLTERGASVAEFDRRVAGAEREPVVECHGTWQSDIDGIAMPLRRGGELYSLTLVVRNGGLADESVTDVLIPALRRAVGALAD